MYTKPWYLQIICTAMGKNTSILLGDHFNKFIEKQIASGQYNSASEVIRAALRMFEYEDRRKERLIQALEEGERSGFVQDLDPATFLDEIKQAQRDVGK